jgi:flagellar protein FlaG
MALRQSQQHAEERAESLRRVQAALPNGEDLRAQAAELEQISLAFNRELRFMVDQQSHEVTVKVIDPETDKVIRVLPPEEMQRMHSKIRETIGFLFDERV